PPSPAPSTATEPTWKRRWQSESQRSSTYLPGAAPWSLPLKRASPFSRVALTVPIFLWVAPKPVGHAWLKLLKMTSTLTWPGPLFATAPETPSARAISDAPSSTLGCRFPHQVFRGMTAAPLARLAYGTGWSIAQDVAPVNRRLLTRFERH